MARTPSPDKCLARDLESELEVARTEGSYLFDSKGKKYIDWVMGWCVGNLGWAVPEIESKVAKLRGPEYVYPGYTYKGWGRLSELLISIAPGKLTKCCRATGGSEAVDFALQAAMLHTGRKGFLSVEGSYHGNTIAGLSVAASDNREKSLNLLSHCTRVDPPLDAKVLAGIERRLKGRHVAAFIMEPISMNLGVLIPDIEFMTGLQRLCRQYGTLLIMDEVATGFGRTGTMFACEQFAIEPDIMCVAKAMSAGICGIGAVMTTAAVARSMEEEGSFYSTYGWHPRSVDAAIATIRYLNTHKKQLLGNVARLSDYFRARLSLIKFDGAATLHIQGLAIGIKLKEGYADKLQKKCLNAGLLTSTEDNTLLLLPALNVTEDVAKRGLDILERCVES